MKASTILFLAGMISFYSMADVQAQRPGGEGRQSIISDSVVVDICDSVKIKKMKALIDTCKEAADPMACIQDASEEDKGLYFKFCTMGDEPGEVAVPVDRERGGDGTSSVRQRGGGGYDTIVGGSGGYDTIVGGGTDGKTIVGGDGSWAVKAEIKMPSETMPTETLPSPIALLPPCACVEKMKESFPTCGFTSCEVEVPPPPPPAVEPNADPEKGQVGAPGPRSNVEVSGGGCFSSLSPNAGYPLGWIWLSLAPALLAARRITRSK